MFNKNSCRGCGCSLIPTSICNICTEHVSWIGGECDKIDEIIHSHNNPLIPYKPEKIPLGNKNKKTLHSVISNVAVSDSSTLPLQLVWLEQNIPRDIFFK